MRSFLIGLFLGCVLTAGVGVSAGLKGPQLSGRSGPLKYVVLEGDEVVCENPWVDVRGKTIECFTEEPDGPADRVDPDRHVAE